MKVISFFIALQTFDTPKDEWIDYMHIVKTNGEWKIINILWQNNNFSAHQNG
ncbi:nuclear transport factor 2 family protein [Flavobacterium sp. ZB4P13]|uniref:nuclear transport factor 2 family protein n=1 Tax=Flavobacterium sp. ZB4P13 TaxID=3401728 RepID=UPI003AB0B33D